MDFCNTFLIWKKDRKQVWALLLKRQRLCTVEDWCDVVFQDHLAVLPRMDLLPMGTSTCEYGLSVRWSWKVSYWSSGGWQQQWPLLLPIMLEVHLSRSDSPGWGGKWLELKTHRIKCEFFYYKKQIHLHYIQSPTWENQDALVSNTELI